MSIQTQEQKILNRLRAGHTLSVRQARYWYGCDRLSARIFNLRSFGWRIRTELVKVRKNKWSARYWLPGGRR